MNKFCPTMRNSGRWILMATVFAPALGNFWHPSYATNGSTYVVPHLPNGKSAFSRQTGLQISVDTTWAGDRGYRPVRVTVNASKPVPAEVLLTIKFNAGDGNYSHHSIVVEQDFAMAPGTTSATTTLYVPQLFDWNTLGWELWVDGEKDEQSSMHWGGFNASGNMDLTAMILQGANRNPMATQFFDQFAGKNIDFASTPTNELLDDWKAYSSLDLIISYPEDLQWFAINSPVQFAKLLRWLRAGGNLWVFDVGYDYENMEELESALGIPTSRTSQEQAAPISEISGWQSLPLGDHSKDSVDDLLTLSGLNHDDDAAVLPGRVLDSDDPETALNSKKWFVARPFGMGTVMAFTTPYGRPWSWRRGKNTNMYGGKSTNMDLVERSLLADRLDWRSRHGNDTSRGNYNFNDLLIPDVGTAPVFEFQLLISLFVICIGPLNYWLLRRRDQLPLLLVTVPVAALATTLLLFAYGFLADGIGVIVRARSFTWLDHQAEEAVCWSRLSYYAGIAPPKGLNMPHDTLVYPLLPSRGSYNRFSRRYAQQEREIVSGKEQQLTRGWLGSRTPTQYLTIAARHSTRHIQFESTTEGLVATNQLGVRILQLVVQDHNESFFLGEAFDQRDSLTLTPTTYLKAMLKLRKRLSDNEPQFPPGYESSSSGGRDLGFRLTDSLMETQLGIITSPVAKEWGNGTYIAITEQGPEVSLGLEKITESNSFHIVRGTFVEETSPSD